MDRSYWGGGPAVGVRTWGRSARVAALFAAAALVATALVITRPTPAHASSAPVIYAVTPNTGPTQGGTGVEIVGSGFTGATSVKFGSATTSCNGGFFVESDTAIFMPSPPNPAGVVDVVVVGPGGSSSIGPADKFTYTTPTTAVVNGVSPNSGSTAGGTGVDIFGTGLATATAVDFGTVAVAAFPSSDNELFVNAPAEAAGTVDITIVNAVGTSAAVPADKFTFAVPGGPVVNAVTPNRSTSRGGDNVIIFGSGFGGATSVHFGATAIAQGSFSVSDTEIFATAPPGTAGTTVDVTVITSGGTSATSNADKFSYLAAGPPHIDGVTVNRGPTVGGTLLELVGSGFTGATSVMFGTHAGTGVQVFTDRRLGVTSPAGVAGTVDITVITPVGTSSTSAADRFTYQPPTVPVIYGVSPHSGPTLGQTFVTILGTGFVPGSTVKFGANAGINQFIFDTEIRVQSPAGAAGTVDITVTSPAGTSAITPLDRFTYVAPGMPAVYGLDHNEGFAGGGTQVTIYGSSFSGATAVSFGGTAAQSKFVISDTQLFATSPAGTAGTSVDVTVTTPVGTSATGNADKFSYLVQPVPTVTGVSPATGPASGGTIVYVTGSGLTNGTASFGGGPPQSAQTISDTVLKVFASPAGTAGTSVDITVTTPGGTSVTSGADKFAYTASVGPTVTSVSPASGPTTGNTTVFIRGSSFTSASAVNFGGTPAAGFFPQSNTLIQATSPAGAAGTVDVTVVNSAGTSPISTADQFTYVATGPPPTPVVTAVSPSSGPASGGSTVYITGTGFTGATQVSFGGTSAFNYFVNNDDLINVTSPAGAVGTVDITVTTGGGTSATGAADKFTYTAAAAPTVSGISPGTGPAAGGTTVYIEGTNFSNVTTVSFGGTSAAGFFLQGPGLLQAVSPPQGASTTVDVTVTTNAGTSATSSADRFVYGGPPPSGLQVNGVTPSSGVANSSTNVEIFGQGFTGATAVKFGSTAAANYFVNSDTFISATAPPEAAGTVDITVTAGGVTSATSPADAFTYAAPSMPVVSAVAPNHGSQLGGDSIQLFGSGFSAATAVKFGATAAANFFVFSDGQMQAQAPAGTGTVDVTVIGPAGTSALSAADKFTYVVPGPPVVNAVDPGSGTAQGGANITLRGSGFTGATAVTFATTAAKNFFVQNDNYISVTTPSGTSTTTVDITVTTAVGTSATSPADRYTFTAPPVPIVNAVTPGRGTTHGGTMVMLLGSGFTGATSVSFGNNPVSFVSPYLDDTLQVSSPAGNVGTVDVTVSGPGGVSATGSADRFTYFVGSAPTVTAVSPNTGRAGTLVFITGTGLSAGDTVLFGTNCQAGFFGVTNSDTLLSVTAPVGVTGTVDVRVVSPDGTSAITPNDQFTFLAPSSPAVTGVAPSSGPSAGGTQVFVTGSGFLGVTGVSFGSTQVAQSFRSGFFAFDDNLLEVTSPAGTSSTTVDIRVTTAAGTSAPGTSDQFTWTPTPVPSVSAVSPNSGPSDGGSETFVSGSGFTNATQMQFGSTVLTPCFFFGGGRGGGPLPFAAGQQPAQAQPGAQQQPAITQRGPLMQQPAPVVTVRVPVVTQVTVRRAKSKTGAAGPAPTTQPVIRTTVPQAVLTPTLQQSLQTGKLAAPAAAAPAAQCRFLVLSDNLIDAGVTAQGSNPATVDVTVATAGGTSATSSADQFTYIATPAPTVTAVSPSGGRSGGGTRVFITGTNLAVPVGVTFGTSPASFFSFSGQCVFLTFVCGGVASSGSLVIATSPAQGSMASTVDVTVTTAGGTSATSASDHFSYTASPTPTVSAVSPSTGPSGTRVFITGTGFLGTSATNFGASTFTAPVPWSFSDNLLIVGSPTHAAGQVDVTVVSPGGTSVVNPNDKYTYTASPTPVVTVVNPSGGPPGAVAYINGSGFTGATAVTFGSTAATKFSVASDSLIIATSPSGSGTVDVTVTNPAGTSALTSSDQWTFGGTLVPTVTSVSPFGGPSAGGTSVTITGTNFTGATAVNFGGALALAFAVNSDTSISATSPPGSGTVDITVTGPNGTSAINIGDKFSYGTPTAPGGVKAIAGDTEATVTWTPPIAGAPITTYTVTVSPGGATTTVSSVVPAATVTGLTNGTAYTFTVAATNSIGTGPSSAVSNLVTPAAVAKNGLVAVLPAMLNNAYGNYLTAAYIENLGGSAAHIRVQYFDSSGAAAGFGNSAAGLAPGATWTVRSDNGNSLGATVPGVADVYSDQPLAVFVNEFAPGGTDATSYTSVAAPSGLSSTLFAPAILNNAYGGYTTGIGLVNLAAATVTITVTYRDTGGALIKTQSFSMAAGAFIGLYSGDPTLALPNMFAGTATITSSGGNLAAVVNEIGPGHQFSSYDAVPTGSTTLFAPAMLRNAYGGYNTGTGIQNTTGTAGTVTFTYYNGAGTPTVTMHSIAANGYLGIYQGTDIPADGAYTAKITSDVPIAAIVNEVAAVTNPAAQLSTSYNTFSGGSSSLHLPLVESAGADGWSTGEGIMNTGTTATTVTVTYFDTATGLQVGTPDVLTLQPNAFWGLYQPAGNLPSGDRASATVTTGAGGQVAVICNESNATSFMSYTAQ